MTTAMLLPLMQYALAQKKEFSKEQFKSISPKGESIQALTCGANFQIMNWFTVACYGQEMVYSGFIQLTSPSWDPKLRVSVIGGQITKITEVRSVWNNKEYFYDNLGMYATNEEIDLTDANQLHQFEIRVKWWSLNTGKLTLNGTGLGSLSCEKTNSFDLNVISPTAPGDIQVASGSSLLTDCNANTVYSYSVSNQAYHSYNWQAPTGWSIVSGQGSNAISIKSNAQNTGGTLSVNATNQCGGNNTKTATIAINPTSLQAPAAPLLKSGEALGCANGENNYVINPDISSRTSFVNYRWSTSNFSNGQPELSIPVFPDNTNQPAFLTRNAQVRLAYKGISPLYVCAEAIYGCGTSPKNCSPLVTPKGILPITNISRVSTVPYDNLGGVHEFKISGSPYADNEVGITYIYSVKGTLTGGVQPTIVLSNGSNVTTLETASKSINVRANNANGVQVSVFSKSSQCGQSASAFVKDFPFNNSLEFDGNDDYAQLPHNNVMNISGTDGFSLESWINTTAVPASNTNPTILSKISDTPGQGTQGFVFGLNSAGKIFLDLNGYRYTSTDSRNLRDGNCHHIAAVRNYTTRNIEFYIDGQPVGNVLGQIRVDLANTNGLKIGNWTYNTTIYPFKSVIDEVRLWKAYRTAQQIQDYWRTSLLGNETGLIAYWKLNDGAGQIIKDFSPNGLNGTLGSNGSASDGNDPIWKTQYAVCSNIARQGDAGNNDEVANTSRVSIFPNPATNTVNIEVANNAAIEQVRLMDIHGKEIANLATANTIDVSTLSSGLYYIELQIGGKTERKKLQVVK